MHKHIHQILRPSLNIQHALKIAPRTHYHCIGQRRCFTIDPTYRQASDWSANQYLKFGDERTIPVRDLLSKVPLTSPKRIIDLGCGPGNSTAVLAERYPDANITGMDSSPDMLEKARTALPKLEFAQADLGNYTPDASAELLFSNAVFHWLPPQQRIEVMKRLLQNSSSGSVLAIQVPDNTLEPSHASMRSAAAEENTKAGLEDSNSLNHAFPRPEQLYNELKPICSHVNIWRTIYNHILDDHQAIVEWVKGTGLRPFIDPLSDGQRKKFLENYLKKLENSYETLHDGKVLLRYPRLFIVAVRS